MTPKQKIIAETIITQTCNEFKVHKENMVAQHTAALLLSETYFSIEETADLLLRDLQEALKNAAVANNAFVGNRDYRMRVYKVITEIQIELGFWKNKKRSIINKYDLPKVRSCNYDSFYQPKSRKNKNN